MYYDLDAGVKIMTYYLIKVNNSVISFASMHNSNSGFFQSIEMWPWHQVTSSPQFLNRYIKTIRINNLDSSFAIYNLQVLWPWRLFQNNDILYDQSKQFSNIIHFYAWKQFRLFSIHRNVTLTSGYYTFPCFGHVKYPGRQ